MGSNKREKLNVAKQIYQDVMNRICNDKEEWKAFLEFSSKFYKYSFTENLLLAREFLTDRFAELRRQQGTV